MWAPFCTGWSRAWQEAGSDCTGSNCPHRCPRLPSPQPRIQLPLHPSRHCRGMKQIPMSSERDTSLVTACDPTPDPPNLSSVLIPPIHWLGHGYHSPGQKAPGETRTPCTLTHAIPPRKPSGNIKCAPIVETVLNFLKILLTNAVIAFLFIHPKEFKSASPESQLLCS